MTTTSTTTNFNFRTKFKKLISAENYIYVNRAFEEFCNLSSCEARERLWRLTYSSQSAVAEIAKLNLTLSIIPPVNFMAFRNELRFQYEEIYPYLLKPSMDAKIEPAYSTLVAKTDKVVASNIFDHCHAIMQTGEDIGRILFLLKSEKDTNYFGGIRSLNFNMDEAEYLKPYHIEIHNLLASMKDFFENDVPFHMEKEEDDENEEVEAQISEEECNESHEEKPNEILKKFKLITPEELLIHRDVFYSYVNGSDMNILLEIGHLGFDLNEVIEKKAKIQSFLYAAEDLS